MTACVPFVAIVAAFAAAAAWHIATPARRVAQFHRLIADDRPVAHDYGDAAVVRMDRLGCAGACPSYSVRIHGSGEIEFVGSAFVCIKHPLGDRVLRETAQRLIDAMARVDFDHLRRPSRPPAAGAPITVTSLQLDTGSHGVEDDGASDMPPVIGEIERQIDRVAGTARWKRIPRNDGEHVPFCPGPDGSKTVFDADGQLVPEAAASAPTPAPEPDAPANTDPVATFDAILAGRRPPPTVFADNASITLRRTACYGTCPVYSVRVTGAGRVEFKGEQFTCVADPPPAQVERVVAQRLMNALAVAGFARLPDFTREDATDAPSVDMTLSDGHASHRVAHYLGMTDVPPQLARFEHAIDDIAASARWLPSGPDRSCGRPDGTRYRFSRGGETVPVERAASAPGA